MTIFSPRASAMEPHVGDEEVSEAWSRACNDLIKRVVTSFPDTFIGVCQLPQSPGVSIKNSIEELERCVLELGFVGLNLNPDPSGGWWNGRRSPTAWYPMYEKMVELDVPAMIHVSGSCNPNFHSTGAHYMNADTTAFMQLLQGDLFADFPDLRFIIPHGGGAVPYHWGRYRGLADMLDKPPLAEHLMHNVFFDTCVYHQPGIDLLFDVIDLDNILFGSEMVGAVRGIDPETGNTSTTPSDSSTRSPHPTPARAGLFGQRPTGLPTPRRRTDRSGPLMISTFTMDADWLEFDPHPSAPDLSVAQRHGRRALSRLWSRQTSFPTRPNESTRRVTPARTNSLRLRDFLGVEERDRAGHVSRLG
jgi:predicted TIM-barrel fold metal-dependent hydrolase